MRKFLLCCCGAALLAACTNQVQNTSGKEYIARTKSAPAPSEIIKTTHYADDGETYTETREVLSTDELVRRAANVEPTLTLPARIGLARIEHGDLTVIPSHESGIWQTLAGRFPGMGQAVPVDPFLAEYTRETILPQDKSKLRSDAGNIITKIRLGAARQHLDAVLIYEVGARGPTAGTYGLGSVRVLGAAGLDREAPGKRGIARAILLDVRNGYPYATISATANLEGAEPDFWASDAKGKAYVEATRRIAEVLSQEVGEVFAKITAASQAKLARK